MIPCLDQSAKVLNELEEKWEYPFYQLSTPLTRYKRDSNRPFIYDNGAFSIDPLDNPHWKPEVAASEINCLGVVLPDVVANHAATVYRFHRNKMGIPNHLRAFVLQNGAKPDNIPWGEFEMLFIGGDDSFKDFWGIQISRYAKMKNYVSHIHVGRVNTIRRLQKWEGIADTFDGSGLVRFGMLDDVMKALVEMKSSVQTRLEVE